MAAHRHIWRAVGWTNLCRCACGDECRWWELPWDEEPFHVRRFVSKREQAEYERKIREAI